MIREALDAYSKKQQINYLVESIKSDGITLNENSIEDLKKQIKKLLTDVDDYVTLNDILNALFKESFEEFFNKIAENKEIDHKTMNEFKRFFYNTSGRFEDKMEFLKAINGDGIWDGDAIINASKPTSLFSSKILKLTNPFIEEMTEKLKYWKAPLGAKSGVGAGEGIFIFYVKNANKADVGDIKIGSKTYEVKANSKSNGSSGGRLLGTTSDWIKPPSVYDTAMGMIQDMATAKNVIADTSKNNFGFVGSYLKNWNEILKGNKKVSAAVLEKIISMMYVNTKADFSWIKDNIEKDGTITEKFLDAFLAFQFDYYQKIENFDGVIFFNLPKNTVSTYHDKKSFEKDIKSGKFVYGGFNWQQDRNLAFQVGMRG
jgi:hypothetical protein